MLANLIVTAMVGHRRGDPDAAGPQAEAQVTESGARRQLRMVLVGALNWQSRG